MARPRRRFAVRTREVGHPLRRRPSAAAGARRHRLGRATRRDRRADHRRGRPNAGPVLVDARRQGRRRDHARTPRHPGALPGRRHHVGLGAAVRRRRRDVAVRHAVAVAGRGRARPVAVAGTHRPHPVPPARRPAADRAPARGGGPRRQRVHGRRRQPRGAAVGAGRRAPAAPRRRPRRGRGARLADGHGAIRRLICARRCRRSGRRRTRIGCAKRSNVCAPADCFNYPCCQFPVTERRRP